jgi:ribosomal protein S18 acetylase RimI-like enzyme
MFTILEASILDLNNLRKLEQICFPQDAWPLLDLIAVLTFPGVVRLKANENGNMMAFIAGDPRPSQQVGWIATVGVLPEYRRQGIGRALIEECEKRLKMRSVRLSVRVDNLEAITLYERMGYYRIEIWKNYYNDGGSALVMEKTVNPDPDL